MRTLLSQRMEYPLNSKMVCMRSRPMNSTMTSCGISLCRIRDNYQDPNRTIPLSAFTTISSGYDSTAVTCLAKKLGVDTCFTLKKSASWIRWSSKYATDDGTLAAQATQPQYYLCRRLSLRHYGGRTLFPIHKLWEIPD